MQKKHKDKVLLRGIAANRGSITGRVWIIKNPSTLPKVKKNMIIVAPFSTPILAPILSVATGLITEIGGITCHAAIISRELNLPCIVGVAHATKVLRNGQEIILNANKGLVYGAEQ